MVRLGRRLISGLLGLAFVLALPLTSATVARAGGYKHGHHGYGIHGGYNYGHYGYRRYRYRGHHGYHDYYGVAAVVVGGLLIAHLLSRPSYRSPPRQTTSTITRVTPVPAGLGNCKPTTGVRAMNGRRALLSGTWCSDRQGRGYILNDSVRFLQYLN